MTPKSRRSRAATTVATAAAVALLLVTAGCGTGTGPSGSGGSKGGAEVVKTHVDVDTPQLREQKRAAGIEDCVAPTAPPVEDGGLPAMTLPCLGGGPAVQLDRLRGPLVINLFAQWCEPCRRELPYYQQLSEQAKGKVTVIGIDYLDTQPGAALELARQTGVTYPLLADPDGALRQDLRLPALPGIVLVDAQGKVTTPRGRAILTEIRSYGQLRDLVKQYLGVAV